MSWQTYVDDTLVAQGGLSKAAILGKQGGVWAATKGYTLSQKEQDFVTKTAFSNPDAAQANGITLGGIKFMCIQADAEEVIGRKGETGVFICPTQQAILVAEYGAGKPAGEANVAVTSLATYLKGLGY